MGRTVRRLAPELGVRIVGAIDIGDSAAESITECDAVMDFSVHTATLSLVETAATHGKPVVIGTTGHTENERTAVTASTTRIPIVWAGNFSIGVNLLLHLTEMAAGILGSDYEAEIIDLHHSQKVDAPSGTAVALIEVIRQARGLDAEGIRFGREGIIGVRPKDEIGVHSLRGGDVVGDHTVLFAGDGERIELIHRASDRRNFAKGAIQAARWVLSRDPGLYSMRDVLGLG